MEEAGNDVTLQEDLEFIANAVLPWKKLNGKAILITGATGLIGSQIVKALACRNRMAQERIHIIAGIRDKEKAAKVFHDILNRKEITFINTDASQPVEIESPIDYIIHTASITASKEFVTHPVEVISTAIDGMRHILDLAKAKHVQGVVYLSSMEAFGVIAGKTGKSSENDLGYIALNNPRSCYPESKRMAECLCSAYASEYSIPVKIARLSQTFGAGILYSENRVFAQFAKSAIEQKDIVLHTRGLSWGNYCYTSDTILAILTLLFKGEEGETYTITNEESNVRIKDMAQLVADKIAGGKIKVIFDIPESNLTFGYAPDTELHLSSAKMRALGWHAEISLEESYRRLIKSMLCSKDV